MTRAPGIIAISQRVDILSSRGERRDALDQRWYDFLVACGFLAVPIPNRAAQAVSILASIRPVGIVFSGGNDLSDLGGDAPERDETERAMLTWALEHKVPVVGICRGLQMILHASGAALKTVPGHVGVRHSLEWLGRTIDVNSYHNWSLDSVPAEFVVTARSDDGFVEAARHRSKPLSGIMWHPERESPFAAHDIAMFKTTFGNAS